MLGSHSVEEWAGRTRLGDLGTLYLADRVEVCIELGSQGLLQTLDISIRPRWPWREQNPRP